ncbi:hypothetical protein SAY87_002014 [Trapa incisa]|uniref:Protein kinase domain-containing protein n=1 Tax=Trapa incisa TaxID=236973 RepID=A0AAN7JWB3_9MYRT|nr:hypothetical protein SAY87_002014 [Trapa incisa]
MDCSSTAFNSAPGSASTRSSTDETLRVKFLCSFSGSILPRPQDGKLRYVGGETRIVNVPRDISYDDLMNRMKELFEGVAVLKYQQPDEDLDALVSVLNDDDVTNMMEEYDKLGVGDGFTRLRIFLFSHPEQDGSLHYIEVDDGNSERRYVDALNNMNDASHFRKQQLLDSSMIGAVESMHLAEQFPMSGEMGVPHPNLQHLTIPRVGSGQIQIESPWSPAYYSPRHHMPQELRGEFQTSPSPARYGMPFSGDISDECPWQQQAHRDHHQQQRYPENIILVPSSGLPSGDMGFPGNLHHVPNVLDGNVCEHCRMSFERSQPYLDISTQCAECPSARDNYLVTNPNLKPLHVAPPREQDPRVLYSETSSQERGWTQAHQLNPHGEEKRVHVVGAGTLRLNDYAVRDGPGMNFSIGHHNLVDGHVSPSYAPQVGLDLSGEAFHDSMAGPQHIPLGYVYGGDNNVHGLPYEHHLHPQTVWGNAANATHGRSSYEASHSLQQLNGTTGPEFLMATPDGSPRFYDGFDSHILRLEPSKKTFDLDGSGPALAINQSGHFPESLHSYAHDMLQDPQGVPSNGISINKSVDGGKKEQTEEGNEAKNMEAPRDEVVNTKQNSKSCESSRASCLMENGNGGKVINLSEVDVSLKTAPLLDEGDLKGNPKTGGDPDSADTSKYFKEAKSNSAEGTNTQGELEVGSDEHGNKSKIEPTKAEEEAISRGLQTIKYDDLEEIRELGSGTYGAVYHGKWKGSDVAIKKIKASCFAGRPAERERLIADFWKEALILGSLHHPNVVSFYGIVRGGPDGSLATVTEFMINGSLKQFLHKKDRTIDRRKRLIIAMDAAFGMEYLHGKNIVHFDLKCENLLVNMRDPQRPVCKIGDLGLSKVKQQTLVSGGVRGTLPWMAPELLSGKSNMVTEKIDVYSFGIVMWEVLTGEEPYADMHCVSIIGGIVNNSLRPQIPTWCDPEWKSLMESCWASDPSGRPSFSEISQKLRSMAAAINVK